MYDSLPEKISEINLCISFSSELVQLKLNIEESGGDSTPPDLDPTYRGESLNSIRYND